MNACPPSRPKLSQTRKAIAQSIHERKLTLLHLSFQKKKKKKIGNAEKIESPCGEEAGESREKGTLLLKEGERVKVSFGLSWFCRAQKLIQTRREDLDQTRIH
uniref:Uncharacterized protein n=1 Tax=Salix viminalis TaxID=40686 RepID=A0A6N2LT61_SALVM